MESELRDLSSKTPPPPPPTSVPPSEPECQHPPSMSADGGASADDDRPLLKPDEPAGITPSEIRELEKKFAAYVRNDTYGSMGRGELPLGEKMLLGIALLTLVPLRVVLALIVLVVYYLICRVCTALKAPNREGEEEQEDYAHMGGWRRAVIVRSGRFLSRVLLFVLGFYWISETHRSISRGEEKSSTEVLSKVVLFSFSKTQKKKKRRKFHLRALTSLSVFSDFRNERRAVIIIIIIAIC